jgi:hypothetical protein
MRTLSHRLAVIVFAPLAYWLLAGQSSTDNAHIDIGKSDDWKSYDNMPLEESGDFKSAAMSLMICPMMKLKDKQPQTKFHTYIDVDDDGHAMLTAAPMRDESDVQWAVTTTRNGADQIHVELHADEDASSATVAEIWQLLKRCEAIK